MAFKTLKPGLMFLNILQRSKIVFKKTDSYKQDFPNDLFVDAHPQAILSNWNITIKPLYFGSII